MSHAIPLAAKVVRFSGASGQHLFVVAGSRIFDVDERTAAAVDRALRLDDEDQLPAGVASLLLHGPQQPPPEHAPAVTALSLNLVQACNMGCSYCYAEQGGFGGAKRAMSAEVARTAVDRLLQGAPPGGRVVIAYMGGEPFLARGLLHETSRYACDAARQSGRSVAFAVTTNATLITEEDAAMLAELGFSVTVSIDGPAPTQDRQRPMANGGPSSVRVLGGIARLLACRPRELTARMSATTHTGALLPVLDHVLGLGFDSAGFAPVIASPHRHGELSGEALACYTAELIRCGRHALCEWKAGRPYHFSNFEAAMSELHRGSARPHPCGAGAGYLSVDAQGEVFACHRLVGNAEFRYGSLAQGIDDSARLAHLLNRSVDTQQPCRTCWARYLCGGGCYHEVSQRGRTACDHVRSWLAFCLEAYAELSEARPELFGGLPHTNADPGFAAALPTPMS